MQTIFLVGNKLTIECMGEHDKIIDILFLFLIIYRSENKIKCPC